MIRRTNTFQVIREAIKDQTVITAQYEAQGCSALIKAADGNLYEVSVKPVRYSDSYKRFAEVEAENDK